MHVKEWVECLVDNEVCRRVMQFIFGSDNYICRGGGGDFCLGGCVEYQNLHQDMGDPIGNSDPSPEPAVTIRDSPPPACTCNFAMQDLTFENGPIRQVPHMQNTRSPFVPLADEPEWMRLSTVLVPAGSVIMRDVRCWHGGTPNLSDAPRALPNAEFLAPWFHEQLRRTMPRDLYESLSAHGQLTCRFIVADPGEELQIGYRSGGDSFGKSAAAVMAARKGRQAALSCKL